MRQKLIGIKLQKRQILLKERYSNSGGTTETANNVWGGDNFPYLQSVQTSGEDGYTQYSSEVELTKDEFINKIKEKHQDFEINFDDPNSIQILEYTESGRVRTIKLGNIQIAGTEARTLFGLKSTNFSFEIDGDKIRFKVLGYGHGVGMSQTGADSMAKAGSNCEEIIKHFYNGVEVNWVNDLQLVPLEENYLNKIFTLFCYISLLQFLLNYNIIEKSKKRQKMLKLIQLKRI